MRFKHGFSGTPEYKSWRSMLERCYVTSHKSYPSYGGRGVTVCDEWKSDFLAFLRYMGPRPARSFSLDRYPNTDGNYEPGNCRWASYLEQQNNRRKTTFVEHEGKRIALADLSRLVGIKHVTMKRRYRAGDRGDRLVRQVDERHHSLSKKG